jgi:hypothetical protein
MQSFVKSYRVSLVFLQHLRTCLNDVAKQVLNLQPKSLVEVDRVKVLKHDLQDQASFDVVRIVKISVIQSNRQKTERALHHAKKNINVALVPLDKLLAKHKICIQAWCQVGQNSTVLLLTSGEKSEEISENLAYTFWFLDQTFNAKDQVIIKVDLGWVCHQEEQRLHALFNHWQASAGEILCLVDEPDDVDTFPDSLESWVNCFDALALLWDGDLLLCQV